MIKWCYKNYEFDKIVKLDCNWMTYDHVGERTRARLCSPEKVLICCIIDTIKIILEQTADILKKKIM